LGWCSLESMMIMDERRVQRNKEKYVNKSPQWDGEAQKMLESGMAVRTIVHVREGTASEPNR